MAWERNFEARVMRIREKELKYQKLTFIITVREMLGWFVTTLTYMQGSLECHLVTSMANKVEETADILLGMALQ
jgi:hypothetical protein